MCLKNHLRRERGNNGQTDCIEFYLVPMVVITCTLKGFVEKMKVCMVVTSG